MYGDSSSALECDIYLVTEDWAKYKLVDSIAHDSITSYGQIIITGTDWYDFDITFLVKN